MMARQNRDRCRAIVLAIVLVDVGPLSSDPHRGFGRGSLRATGN
jgi:hypothetical protein